jgi:hypothetical protein
MRTHWLGLYQLIVIFFPPSYCFNNILNSAKTAKVVRDADTGADVILRLVTWLATPPKVGAWQVIANSCPIFKMDRMSKELSGAGGGWSITTPRIFQLLSPAKTVLIAGCGGGYDVTSGLPLYFALRSQGKKVLLANLTFTGLQRKMSGTKSQYCNKCVKVTHDMEINKESYDTYFPELYLSLWFWEKFEERVPIFTFERDAGVNQLKEAYSKICSEHAVDAIVLVDGGTDSLMFGTEERLGTPVEDQTSIMAVNSVAGVPKFLVAIGFGVDSFHGVSHGLFLENVATLEKEGGYLGCFSVPNNSVEGGLYLEAYRAMSQHMQPSIVCASITDAMQGHFGNHHSTKRTGSSKLFINPLMPICWTFDLQKVAAKIPYASALCATESCTDVGNVIFKHHDKLGKEGKLRKPIPLPM